MKTIMSLAWVGIAILALVAGPAVSRNFDCATDLRTVEKMICADPELSALDEEMTVVYNGFLSSTVGSARETLFHGQFVWIGERDKCTSAVCIARMTATRKAELERQIHASNASGKTGAELQADADTLAEVASDAEEEASSSAEALARPEVAPEAANAVPAAPSEPDVSSLPNPKATPTTSRPAIPPPAAFIAAERTAAAGKFAKAAAPEPMFGGGSTSLAVAVIVAFLGIWAASAWGLIRSGQSKSVGIGGGLLAGCVVLAGVGYAFTKGASSALSGPTRTASTSNELAADAIEKPANAMTVADARCDGAAAKKAIIEQLFDHDPKGAIFPHPYSESLFYRSTGADRFSQVIKDAREFQPSTLELEDVLVWKCKTRSDVCVGLEELKRALIDFKATVRAELINFEFLGEAADGTSTCSAMLQFSAPTANEKFMYPITYSARAAGAEVETTRLEPLTIAEEERAERKARSQQLGHDGPFLRPHALVCTTLHGISRGSAIERSGNPYVTADSEECFYSPDGDPVPIRNAKPTEFTDITRAYFVSNGAGFYTRARYVIDNESDEPGAYSAVTQIAPLFRGTARCEVEGPSTFETRDSGLSTPQFNCTLEKGAASDTSFVGTLQCRNNDAQESWPVHVGLFRWGDKTLRIRGSLCEETAASTAAGDAAPISGDEPGANAAEPAGAVMPPSVSEPAASVSPPD